MPYDESCTEITSMKDQFPHAKFLDMGAVKAKAMRNPYTTSHELYDRRKSYGLAHATGVIVALLEDSCIPESNWCEQVIQSHELPYAVIGGAVEQTSKSPLNWAVYFQDFGRYQLPQEEGPVRSLTDINISYKRESLWAVQDCWLNRYNEILVHQALIQNGEVLWQRPQILVRQDRGRLNFLALLQERFAWGKLFGSVRANSISRRERYFLIVCSPGIYFVIISRIAWKVMISQRNRLHFLVSFPLILPLTLSWWFGELIGTLFRSE